MLEKKNDDFFLSVKNTFRDTSSHPNFLLTSVICKKYTHTHTQMHSNLQLYNKWTSYIHFNLVHTSSIGAPSVQQAACVHTSWRLFCCARVCAGVSADRTVVSSETVLDPHATQQQLCSILKASLTKMKATERTRRDVWRNFNSQQSLSLSPRWATRRCMWLVTTATRRWPTSCCRIRPKSTAKPRWGGGGGGKQINQ